MTALRAAFALQLGLLRAKLGHAGVLVAIPFYVLIFFSIVRSHGRTDLDSAALLAPALAGMWTLGLHFAGDIVDGDRWDGVLEAVLAAPTALFRVVLGRSVAVGLVSLLGFVEALVCGLLFFRSTLSLGHPVWFVVALLATAFASVCTCCLIAVVCVLGKSALSFKNSLIYPIYVLGGVFLPVAFLPGWLGVVARAVYLSWSSDLLRAAASTAPIADPVPALAAILGLGVGALVLGALLADIVVRRVRRTGKVLVS